MSVCLSVLVAFFLPCLLALRCHGPCQVVSLCCSITSVSDPAKAGGYSTWVPPYSYAGMAQLEESVGYIENGQCLRNATLKQLLVCPPGQESLPFDELASHCQVLGIKCPKVRPLLPAVLLPRLLACLFTSSVSVREPVSAKYSVATTLAVVA